MTLGAENKSRPLTIRRFSETNLGALQQLAAQNERSLKGEARYAIRTHIDKQGNGSESVSSASERENLTLEPVPKDWRQAEIEKTVGALNSLELKLASLTRKADYFTDSASLIADFNTRIMDQRIALYALDPKHPRAICEALL